MYQVKTVRSGGSIRRAKREGEVGAFTRAQAIERVKVTTTVEGLERWKAHPNKHVQRYAEVKLARIGEAAAAYREFEALVERFRVEGKKNPEASARASLAATARRKQVSATVEN